MKDTKIEWTDRAWNPERFRGIREEDLDAYEEAAQ